MASNLKRTSSIYSSVLAQRRVRRMLIACKSKGDSRHVFHQLEDIFHLNHSDMGFVDLWKAGVSNLENELGFSDLVKQPALLDDLLEHRPPTRVVMRR